MIKIGPAGCTYRGTYWDDGGRDKIALAQIFISHGEYINSLQFLYVENGTSVLSEKHGGDSGLKFNVVTLNYPSEYLVGISGSYTNSYLERVLSISFITNKRTYGPFGSGGGDYDFEYQLGEDHSFGGFHGRANEYLNAIGVYLKPITIQGDVKVDILKMKDSKSPLSLSDSFHYFAGAE